MKNLTILTIVLASAMLCRSQEKLVVAVYYGSTIDTLEFVSTRGTFEVSQYRGTNVITERCGFWGCNFPLAAPVMLSTTAPIKIISKQPF